MTSLFKPSLRKPRSLMLLGLILMVLAACGGPTPTPQVIVVTSTPEQRRAWLDDVQRTVRECFG